MEIISRVKELSKYGELVTGDKKERTVVDKIKEYFEENKLNVKLIPQQVITWSEEEIEVECNGTKIDLISFPYSPSIDIETDDYKVIKVNSIFEVNKYYRKFDSILLFTYDDYMRKIVLKNGRFLQHHPQPPPKLPAFYVRYKDVNKIQGKCRFYLKTSFKESTGYTVEGISYGKSEEKVYVTAHHDHWFYGEHDNLVSVILLPMLKSTRYELHLMSFTAEESGCPFSSFSWSCGSYYYVKNHNIDAKAVISLDNLTPNAQFFVTPGLLSYFSSAVSEPSPYTDSYNFLRAGIPTVSISDVNYYFYHSENDILSNNENFENIIKVINKFLDNEIVFNENELREKVLTSSLPVEIKALASSLIDKGKYKDIIRLYGSVMDLSTGKAEAYLFHKLSGIEKAYVTNVAIEDFDEIINECETKECEELYHMYLSYLYKEALNGYLKILKDLF